MKIREDRAHRGERAGLDSRLLVRRTASAGYNRYMSLPRMLKLVRERSESGYFFEDLAVWNLHDVLSPSPL